MFLLRLIVFTLPFVEYTFGRVIISSNFELKKDGEQNTDDILLLDETQSSGATKNLMKMLTNVKSKGRQLFQEKDVKTSSPKSDDIPRNKRSFFPNVEDSNNWTANIYSISSPYFVSINEFEDSNPSFNSKYTYYNSVDTSTTERLESAKQTSQLTMNLDDMKVNSKIEPGSGEPKKPVWHLTDFKPSTVKSSRQSRSSNRELIPEEEPSPYSILEDIEETESSQHLAQEYMGRNEIPSFPFLVPTTPKPSKCAWAILSCCSTSSEEINYKCFREMECEERYWNTKICSEDFKNVAILTAYKYYNGNINDL